METAAEAADAAERPTSTSAPDEPGARKRASELPPSRQRESQATEPDDKERGGESLQEKDPAFPVLKHKLDVILHPILS